jgi:hypothetical protein
MAMAEIPIYEIATMAADGGTSDDGKGPGDSE